MTLSSGNVNECPNEPQCHGAQNSHKHSNQQNSLWPVLGDLWGVACFHGCGKNVNKVNEVLANTDLQGIQFFVFKANCFYFSSKRGIYQPSSHPFTQRHLTSRNENRCVTTLKKAVKETGPLKNTFIDNFILVIEVKVNVQDFFCIYLSLHPPLFSTVQGIH